MVLKVALQELLTLRLREQGEGLPTTLSFRTGSGASSLGCDSSGSSVLLVTTGLDNTHSFRSAGGWSLSGAGTGLGADFPG